MGLFGLFKNSGNTSNSEIGNSNVPFDTSPESLIGRNTSFNFDGLAEIAVFVKKYWAGRKQKLMISQGDEYMNCYLKAYNLYEQGKFNEAIKVLHDSLKINPMGIKARFELVECYLNLKDTETAKKELM